MSDTDHGTGHEDRGQGAGATSGLGTVYRALDRLLEERGLGDAALVVDVPALGRQVLRAGRRPLRDDDHSLLTRAPGLYVEPSSDGPFGTVDDALVEELMVALAEIGLRHDAASFTRLAADVDDVLAGHDDEGAE